MRSRHSWPGHACWPAALWPGLVALAATMTLAVEVPTGQPVLGVDLPAYLRTADLLWSWNATGTVLDPLAPVHWYQVRALLYASTRDPSQSLFFTQTHLYRLFFFLFFNRRFSCREPTLAMDSWEGF